MNEKCLPLNCSCQLWWVTHQRLTDWINEWLDWAPPHVHTQTYINTHADTHTKVCMHKYTNGTGLPTKLLGMSVLESINMRVKKKGQLNKRKKSMCIDEQGWHKKQDLLFEWPDRLSSYACLVYARQYLLLQDVAISNVSVSGFVPPLFTHGKNALCRPESCREKKINTESLGQTDRQTDRRVEVPVVNFTKSRGTISAPWKQCWMTKWISHFVPKQVPG